MHIITSRVHGILDYSVGILLILAPWLFGFAYGGWETWVPVILGLGAIGYSVFTDYELGVFPFIPLPVHLWIDAGAGLLLAASPWLFGFSHLVWLPHLILGLFEIGAAALTQPAPQFGSRRHRHHAP